MSNYEACTVLFACQNVLPCSIMVVDIVTWVSNLHPVASINSRVKVILGFVKISF